MLKLINETVDFLKQKGFENAEIGIILGTGLGQLINDIKIICQVSYNQIPNFPTATVELHKEKLIYGIIGGKKTIVMQGRFHLYEGYSLQDVSYPVRIMESLGIPTPWGPQHASFCFGAVISPSGAQAVSFKAVYSRYLIFLAKKTTLFIELDFIIVYFSASNT